MSPTWDILISSVYARAERLNALLEYLGHQMRPGVHVYVCQDNCEMPIGEKVQLLVDSSNGDYLCTIGDDDWVAGIYVQAITDALAHNPDYVSFLGRYQGELVSYSMNPANWKGARYTSELLGTLQVTRREIVTRVRFAGGVGEDRRWATEIKALDVIKSEAFIDAELYEYRWNPYDSIQTGTVKRTDVVPAQPAYPFVTWVPPTAGGTP